jgi:hypothetical protein
MAGSETRHLRSQVHTAFDPLWRGGPMARTEAYDWMAHVLGIERERAHIGMLDKGQCELLLEKVAEKKLLLRNNKHWSQRARKKRNK